MYRFHLKIIYFVQKSISIEAREIVGVDIVEINNKGSLNKQNRSVCLILLLKKQVKYPKIYSQTNIGLKVLVIASMLRLT